MSAITILGNACPTSFQVILSVPSPLPVEETINRSRLKMIKPQTHPNSMEPIIVPMLNTKSSIASPLGPNIVLKAYPPENAANKPVHSTIPPIPAYLTLSCIGEIFKKCSSAPAHHHKNLEILLGSLAK